MATKPYHHGNLRQALIDAALKLLAEGGLRSLTLRSVAQEAGVAPSAMYRHYESKDALLAGVAQEGFAKLFRAGEKEMSRSGGDPQAMYNGMSKTYVGFALENPDQVRVMFSNVIDDRSRFPELQETSRKSFQQLFETVKACQAGGLVKAGQDPRLVTLALWSMYHGLSMLAIEGQLESNVSPKKSRVLARTLGKLVLEGLGTETGPADS